MVKEKIQIVKNAKKQMLTSKIILCIDVSKLIKVSGFEELPSSCNLCQSYAEYFELISGN